MKPGKFLTAEWRYLAMINYEVDPAILLPFVPRGTELDKWKERTFVSIVGFRFLKTLVLGVPIPFHRNFDEINLRFYVRRPAADGWRRGVVFIKEIVPRPAIAMVARVIYNENYVAREMRHEIGFDEGESGQLGSVGYGWREGRKWNHLRVGVSGEPVALKTGSQEEFITEHYWGYATQRDGGCVEYQVEHPPWRVWQVDTTELDCDVERVYGRRFVEFLRAGHASAFVAEGSPVIVRRGVRI
jgi:uncharacterized protein YqjF (DUF2071 family)